MNAILMPSVSLDENLQTDNLLIEANIPVVDAEEQLGDLSQPATVDDLVSAAERYRALGLNPIPLPDSKIPKGISGWQNKTFDEDDFRHHLSGVIGPGIGIQNGPTSNIVDCEWDCREQRDTFFQIFNGEENVPEGPAFGRLEDPLHEHRLFLERLTFACSVSIMGKPAPRILRGNGI